MGNFPIAAIPALQVQAQTPVTGFALQNATPTILTWTAPNDGQMHTAMIIGITGVSSAETGGQVNCQYTDMAGNAQNAVLTAGALAVGTTPFNNALNRTMILLPPGGTLTIVQNSALTAGAASVWAKIWGA